MEESEDYLKQSKNLYAGESNSDDYKQEFESQGKQEHSSEGETAMPLITQEDFEIIT